MFKKNISVLITTFLVSANSVASDFSGYVTAKIDTFNCIMNQDYKPEIILRLDVVKNFGLKEQHIIFTNILSKSDFCYDLSSFNNFFSMNNNKVQIWLQTYQSQIFKMNQKDSSCEKYLNEDVYIAV